VLRTKAQSGSAAVHASIERVCALHVHNGGSAELRVEVDDNVMLLLRAVAGTRNRLLRLLFLAVDARAGVAYKRWLAQAWATRLGATATPDAAELAHAL
jgi:hypothetical protein